jgi:hypothetical protein
MTKATFIDVIAAAVSNGQGQGPAIADSSDGIDFLGDWNAPPQKADVHAWEASYDRFASWVEAQGGSFGGEETDCANVGYRATAEDQGLSLTQEFKADFDATLPDTSGDATFLAIAALPAW